MLEKLLIISIICLFVLTPYGKGAFESGDNTWVYDEETGRWSIEFSGEVHESFILTYGFIQPFRVGVRFTHEHSFPEDAVGYLEASRDHGETWMLLSEFKDTCDVGKNIYTTITSNSLWVRFTIDSSEGSGHWSIWDINIIGDTRGNPPNVWVSISGPLNDGRWWSAPPQIHVIASDRLGIKEIVFIDNTYGVEYFSSSNDLYFRLFNGIHQCFYWAVDNYGNENTPILLPLIYVDAGEPPIVEIINPSMGLYLFGKQIPIQINKPFIIGDFNFVVNASDITSGLYRVQFLLNGKVIGEDTSPPYKTHCYQKNMGEARITAFAEDYSGNSASDTLDVYYYNFI